ncbi:MAG: hypothetical protein LUE29_12475 [Lachnospiraceae bacterium]|nr:hypothetical protein [Lachnospiraceae bacterium]
MEQIWWERVPNAAAFLADIVDSLLNERSIVLNSAEEFPWYSFMERNIREAVKQQNAMKGFEILEDVSEPGPYLLDNFCKSSKRTEYRPTRTYAKFLAESDDIVLHDRYLWVKVTSNKQFKAWCEFVSEYTKERGKNKVAAVFVLEWTGGSVTTARKGIKLFSFDAYVSEYDRTVFCSLAASAVQERSFVKNYLTELAANVVGNDMELCALCLARHREFLQDPYAATRRILAEEIRSDGRKFGFSRSKAEVEHLIWRAQIRSVYPALEEFRQDFVQKHYPEIARMLPMTSACDETFNVPEEVELGTLRQMAGSGRLFLQMKESERLKGCWEARNKLSHLTALSFDEVAELEV